MRRLQWCCLANANVVALSIKPGESLFRDNANVVVMLCELILSHNVVALSMVAIVSLLILY